MVRLSKYPQATWQEAAKFFLEEAGDAQRAVVLARKNVGLRQDAASLGLLARCEAALGNHDAAVALVARMLATPIRRASVHADAYRVYALAGRKAEADGQRAAALAMNPKLKL